jgi:hypothetical protein
MIRLFFLLLLCPLLAHASHGYFNPPKDWLIADPALLSPRVQIGFICKTKKGFCPSLNMATEEVEVSLDEYLKAVKNIHEADHHNRWRKVGKILTRAGEAQLTEIDTKTQWGAVRLLQLILLKDHVAYVLTAAALKEDFAQFYKEFQSAFQSFTIVDDLFSAISSGKREGFTQKNKQLQEALIASKKKFEDRSFQKKHWEPFQKMVIEDFADLGAHWQVLALKSVQENLTKLSSAEYK